jgi:hypothetical protein
MKKWILLSTLLVSASGFSEEKPGFTQCGDYVVKGVLIQNTTDTTKVNPVIYKVNQKTKSEMAFTFKAEDLGLVSSYLDVPTTMKVKILKKMEGTKGEIAEVNGVSIRKPNPLDPYSDSGIFFQSARHCQ